jgi:hypothetical protein
VKCPAERKSLSEQADDNRQAVWIPCHAASTQAHLRDHAPQCRDVRPGSAEVVGTQICGDDPEVYKGV